MSKNSTVHHLIQQSMQNHSAEAAGRPAPRLADGTVNPEWRTFWATHFEETPEEMKASTPATSGVGFGTAPGNTASTKQVSFLKSLLDERKGQHRAEEIRAEMNTMWSLRRFTKAEASKRITELMGMAKTATPAPAAAAPSVDVPAGRYAVETEEGHLAFYKVDRPTEGRWAGYTFVKLQVSDDEQRLPSRAAEQGVLRKIAEDPQAAMLRYGREIGSCGHCGRTLTNEESREAGIGPVCRAKMDW